MSKSAKSVAKAKAKYPILAKYNLYPFTCATLRMNEQKKKASVSMPPDGVGSIAEMLKVVDPNKAKSMVELALSKLRTEPVEHIHGHFAEMKEVVGVFAKKNISLIDKARGVKKSEYDLAIDELKRAEKVLIENHHFTVDEMSHEILTKINLVKSNNISN